MSHTRGILVYTSAFVYSVISNLPPIATDHALVKRIFAEREEQITSNGSLLALLSYKESVSEFYKTVSFINGPELEKIEEYLHVSISRNVVFFTSTTLSALALTMEYPQVVIAPVIGILYLIAFGNDIQKEYEAKKKINSLKFFEDTLLELDYHKLLEDLKG